MPAAPSYLNMKFYSVIMIYVLAKRLWWTPTLVSVLDYGANTWPFLLACAGLARFRCLQGRMSDGL